MSAFTGRRGPWKRCGHSSAGPRPPSTAPPSSPSASTPTRPPGRQPVPLPNSRFLTSDEHQETGVRLEGGAEAEWGAGVPEVFVQSGTFPAGGTWSVEASEYHSSSSLMKPRGGKVIPKVCKAEARVGAWSGAAR